MTMPPTVLATRDSGVMDRHEHEPSSAAKPRRRTFTAEKKLVLLAEYDAASAEERGGRLGLKRIHRSRCSRLEKGDGLCVPPQALELRCLGRVGSGPARGSS